MGSEKKKAPANARTKELWLEEEELDSLGVRVWRRNEFNDAGELGNLTNGIKHAMLQAYRNSCIE